MRALLQRATELFGALYILSFFTFIGLLVYTGRAGIARPDATHTVGTTDHGRTYYLTVWQSESCFWAGVTMGASAAMTLLSFVSTEIIKRPRPS